MSRELYMVILVLLMALVTYAIRVIPLAFVRKKIKSRYIKSVLYYMPYAVLAAMTFPYIFYSTGNFYTALIGTVIAIVASSLKQSLIVVALISCAAVFGFGFLF